MKKKIALYHSDHDGDLSGAIIQRHLKDDNPVMIRIGYDEEFPWNLIDYDTEVWMADFSLQPWLKMERLYYSCKKLVWIDHHKTSIENYDKWTEETGHVIAGTRQDGRAACSLCWDYCNPKTLEPHCVYLTSQYDIWRWHNIKNCIEYQYGLYLYETNPSTKEGEAFWNAQIERYLDSYLPVVVLGKSFMGYKDRSSIESMKKYAFETTFHGYNVIAANKKNNSRMFDSVWDPKKYHFMLTFAWMKDGWSVSMYTERKDVDVSAIAKLHGGGGHCGAAGFSCKELPFELR